MKPKYQGLIRNLGFLLIFEITPAWSLSLAVETAGRVPTPLGTPITWYASADESSGTIWYRFRLRSPIDYRFTVVRDFHPNPAWLWVPSQVEGRYDIEVTAWNRDTDSTEVTTVHYDVSSVVIAGDPVITRTSHELVFLYSAPPCTSGSTMTVEFTAPDGFRQSTPPAACLQDRSMNVYLAGLRAETEYSVHHVIISPDGQLSSGPTMTLATGPLSFTPAPTRALIRALGQGVVFQNRVFERSIATDFDGNIIWYSPHATPYLTEPEKGGYFFALIENPFEGPSSQFLRQVDLAGNVVLETNAGAINEQLAGLGKQPITSFHHEAKRLPNGNILVLAGTERLVTDTQGSGEVDVLGDMILVLDRDMRVVWTWDAFDHLDPTRQALMGEKCYPGQGGCAVFYLAQQANDWLHGNSLALTPDGNIIYSARHQDWIYKIHYAGGYGTGDVLWRLGDEGDFKSVSSDPNPWFSHQHYANVSASGPFDQLLVFDNGNMRRSVNSAANSRGQVFELNPTSQTARLIFNVDLGDYAFALGSAERLPNGNYHFGLGWTAKGGSEFTEYDPSGKLISKMEADTQIYRALRMPDLYTPNESLWR